MIALVAGQVQAASDRDQRLLGGRRAASLLESGHGSRWTCGTVRRAPRAVARGCGAGSLRGRPTSSGCSASRRRRRKTASASRSMLIGALRRVVPVRQRRAASPSSPSSSLFLARRQLAGNGAHRWRGKERQSLDARWQTRHPGSRRPHRCLRSCRSRRTLRPRRALRAHRPPIPPVLTRPSIRLRGGRHGPHDPRPQPSRPHRPPGRDHRSLGRHRRRDRPPPRRRGSGGEYCPYGTRPRASGRPTGSTTRCPVRRCRCAPLGSVLARLRQPSRGCLSWTRGRRSRSSSRTPE